MSKKTKDPISVMPQSTEFYNTVTPCLVFLFVRSLSAVIWSMDYCIQIIQRAKFYDMILNALPNPNMLTDF